MSEEMCGTSYTFDKGSDRGYLAALREVRSIIQQTRKMENTAEFNRALSIIDMLIIKLIDGQQKA